MLKNYLKIALRNLRRQKGYAAINVAGLALGVVCCLLLFLFIQFEAGFDRFHTNADRIYRLLHQERTPDGDYFYRVLQFPDTAPELADAYPAIESYTRLVRSFVLMRDGNDRHVEPFFYADSTVFDVFTLPLRAGDPGAALRDPGTVVISERVARRYFGDREPASVLGERLTVQGDSGLIDFAVVGVMADMPAQSSLEMDILVPFARYPEFGTGANSWGGRASTYLLLREGQDAASLQTAFASYVAANAAGFVDARRNAGYLAEGDDAFQLYLQPLLDLHTEPHIVSVYESATHDPRYSLILAGIGLLVLLLACINFTTLAVGQSVGRAQEVGVRKVLGARREQLMHQFLGESVVMSVMAFGLALLAAWLLVPFFNTLTGLTLSFRALAVPAIVLAMGAACLFIGVLAGSYPTLVLSGFQPIDALKGEARLGGKNRLTRGLVVVQYALAIALMICAVVMGRQLDYIRATNLGFEADQVIVLNTNDFSGQSVQTVEAFKQALAGRPEIAGVSGAGYSFTRSYDNVSWQAPDGTPYASERLRVDYEYLETMGMRLAAGRTFSRAHPSDPTNAAVVNERFVEMMGWTDPLGQQLHGYGPDDAAPLTVIGVVEDYHSQSLHEEIGPVFWHMTPDWPFGNILVRARGGQVAAALQRAEEVWRTVSPDAPFDFFFLDEDVQRQYAGEERWGKIVGSATLIALLISSMGLLGLATLAATRRTKEVGVRKVLGASVPNLVALLSADFLKLVAVATLVAWPLAYVAMQRWLGTFAYRMELGAGLFLAVGAAAVVLAFLAVSYQALRAAWRDPVKSLRYE